MIPVVNKCSADIVSVGDTWTCIEISDDATDAGDVELVHVDFNANVATVRYKGNIHRGPMMIRSDHPSYMGREVAVLFV